ncbi:MAG TPA: hypothetical protein VFN67_00405 [Polyangiales bacterium]|nr:hypothetical protein [Polyangiales bacterium]
MRHTYDEQEDRDRWIAVLLALLLLLLWMLGAPYYLDAGLSKAHATFGPNIRLAATAFSVAGVIVALHPLVARAGRYWPVQRLRGVVMQFTACCFVLVTASLHSSAPAVTAAADFGQRWLPWSIGFALLLLALEYLLRGARHLMHDARYAALVFAMALLGFFGTYRALARALAQEKQRAAQLLAKSKPPAALNDPAYAQTIQAVSDGPPPLETDRGVDTQRTGLGADETQDLQPAQEIDRVHKRDATAIEQWQQKLPAGSTTNHSH